MPQLILLQKTIINIEGVGRYLYPELDLWKTARPQMERWMDERIGVRGLLKGAKINVPKLISRLPDLPNKALDVLDQLHEGKIEMENKSEEIHHLRKEMKSYNQRTVLAVVGSGFLMSASIIYALDNPSPLLQEQCVEVFFTQVFRDNYFHADMHPGNIFVVPAEGGKPARVNVIDFGIMCSLTEFDQHYLADNFIAFLDRDYHRVAALHIESGWVPKGTRMDELESAIRSVCEPLLDRPIHEISFGELLQRLFQIAILDPPLPRIGYLSP